MKGLAGRWRIVEMDNWDRDAIDGGLTGHLFFHLGDDSVFRATPFEAGAGDGR